jgi:hypothetical protein
MHAYSVAQVLVEVYGLKVLQRGDIRVYYVNMTIGIRLGRGRCLYQHHSAETHERRHRCIIRIPSQARSPPLIHGLSVRDPHQTASQARLRKKS